MTGFSKIRALAAKRKGGEEVLRTLLGPVPDNTAIAAVPDDRILSAMTERIFCAGFVWRVIRQKWTGFEDAFLGFQPKPLLFQPEDFWHELTSDSRIVRNGQKIMAVRENAAFVDRIAAEHGSFGRFLAEWPGDDQVGLLAYLAKYGTRLGGNTGQYFLRWIGWDAWIASRDMVAALRQNGLDVAESPTSKRDMEKIQDRMNAYRRESGLCHVHISRILAMSTGDNYDAETIRSRAQHGED